MLHLVLGRVALADDRLLDLQRGVLGHRQPREDRGADRGAASLAERERRLRVHVDEDLLDRDFLRLVCGNDLGQAVENRLQPRSQLARPRANAAARHVVELAACLLDDSETSDAQTRIDAQDAHARHASPSAAVV